VESASLAFLFTFTVVCSLAWWERAGRRLITGPGAVAGATALVALVVRLVRTDPVALIVLVVLALVAVFGRRLLLRRD
jgi:hypothetical protein